MSTEGLVSRTLISDTLQCYWYHEQCQISCVMTTPFLMSTIPLMSWLVPYSCLRLYFCHEQQSIFLCLRCHSCHEQSHSHVYDATHFMNSLILMSLMPILPVTVPNLNFWKSWNFSLSCLRCYQCHEHSFGYDATRVMNILISKISLISWTASYWRCHSCHEHSRFHVYDASRITNSLILMSTMLLVSWTFSFSCLRCHSCHEQSHSHVYDVVTGIMRRPKLKSKMSLNSHILCLLCLWCQSCHKHTQI